jgi:hypothetical protein
MSGCNKYSVTITTFILTYFCTVEAMFYYINPLNTGWNPIFHLLALLGAHPIFHVSRIRVKGCLVPEILQRLIFFLWRCDPTQVMASSFLRFLDYTQRRTTVGSTPPDKWSARHKDLYLTTHNTHNRQTSMLRWDLNPRSQQASGCRPTP